MHYNTICSKLFQFIPRHCFDISVDTVGSDHYCRHFTAWRQFLTCLYTQITGKYSQWEICDGLLTNEVAPAKSTASFSAPRTLSAPKKWREKRTIIVVAHIC